MKDETLNLEEIGASHGVEGILFCCLLLIDKARAKYRTYVRVSVL